jgi:hypothetical protein
MKIQRLGLILTIINLVLLVLLLVQNYSAVVAKENLPVLRGRALEIVDSTGRVRASISVEPAVTMNGRTYPETVLLRLTDPKHGPIVKLEASADGSAMGLSDDAAGGVQLFAKRERTFIRVVDDEGREQIMKP